MTEELRTLLEVQQDDLRIDEVQRQFDALAPRERELDRALQAEISGAERARAEGAAEEERRDTMAQRLEEHRRLHERNVAQLDQVKKMRDAVAAQAQVDMARRILADHESELAQLNTRLAASRSRVEAHEARRMELEESQKAEREAIAARRKELRAQLEAERGARNGKSGAVAPALLNRYERIRRRTKGQALFALRGMSCGACDTTIPLQRRNAMIAGSIDLCEGCGMLVYAAPSAEEEAGG